MREFPSPAPLLPEILALHGRWRGHRDAVITADDRISWASFCADNHRFAHGLHSAGIRPGDRVGVFMSNGYPMLTAIFGTMAAGAVSVPLNTSVSDEAIVAMFRDADIRALLVSADKGVKNVVVNVGEILPMNDIKDPSLLKYSRFEQVKNFSQFIEGI